MSRFAVLSGLLVPGMCTGSCTGRTESTRKRSSATSRSRTADLASRVEGRGSRVQASLGLSADAGIEGACSPRHKPPTNPPQTLTAHSIILHLPDRTVTFGRRETRDFGRELRRHATFAVRAQKHNRRQ
eukprot:2034358-Rhodomonas_salina.2